MDYISVKAATGKWDISKRRIQKLCEENPIEGTLKFGRAWMIPKDALSPLMGGESRKMGLIKRGNREATDNIAIVGGGNHEILLSYSYEKR